MSTAVIRALVVPEDDNPATLSPQAWSLDQLQAAVGGSIDIVQVADWCAVVNDDGVARGLAPNVHATRLAEEAGWQAWPPGWHLRGPVLFFGAADDDGGLTEVRSDLLELATDMGIEVAP